MLCKKCTCIIQDLLRDPDKEFSKTYYNYHAGISSSNVIAGGCEMCKVLVPPRYRSLSRIHEFTEKDHKVEVRKLDTKVPYVYLWFPGCENRQEEWLYMVKSTEITTDFSIKARPPGFQLESTIPTAQRWIKECLDGHEQCPNNTQPLTYPTRLLKIQDSSVRLVLPAEENVSGPYAALSYCWGPNPSFLCLSASNLQTLQDGISHSTLPLAFQEAVRLLKTMGIGYLWIDALCIIQTGPGSQEDWKAEAMKMQEVYSNCIVNLSLATAPNPDSSCLEYQQATGSRAVPPFQVQVNLDHGDNVDSEPEDWTIIPASYYFEGTVNQPLAKRAWVLQERLLAPRVVSLGRGELFWDCNQIPNASETFPSGGLVGPNNLPLAIKSISMNADYQELESIWWTIIGEYSDRSLTYPEKDKLIAFSAIAAKMSQAMNDVYIAGHFWKALPRTLTWMARDYKSLDPGRRRILGQIGGEGRERENLIPTWSWASIDGPIDEGFHLDSKPFAAIAEAKSYEVTLPEGVHPYGQVVCASLIIEAFCMEMEWGTKRFNDLLFAAAFDVLDERPIKGDSVLLAALAHSISPLNGIIQGLILVKKGAAGEKKYARIGLFVIRLVDNRSFARWFEQEKRTLTLV